MTYEKARETIRAAVATVLEITAESIEKQIPKKPIITDHDRDEYFTKRVKCGACGQAIGAFDYGRAWCENSKKVFIEDHRFCGKCGQAIDWSDDND